MERPGHHALNVADDASLEAFFATSDAFDHVVTAQARTTTGPVAMLAVGDPRRAVHHFRERPRLRDEFDQLYEEAETRRRRMVINRFFTYAQNHEGVWFAR